MAPGQASDGLSATATKGHGGVDLLQRYPTKLTAGDVALERARTWEFTSADIFRLSRFDFEAGKDLHVEVGPADLGIGIARMVLCGRW